MPTNNRIRIRKIKKTHEPPQPAPNPVPAPLFAPIVFSPLIEFCHPLYYAAPLGWATDLKAERRLSRQVKELQDLPGEPVAYVKLATSTELTNELSLKRVINVATSYL
jgi:hypothetical protein